MQRSPVILQAPFTDEQVAALNRWQRSNFVHPFTCNGVHDGDRVLVATRDGWVCRHCRYTQDWAHDSMLTEPVNPLR